MSSTQTPGTAEPPEPSQPREPSQPPQASQARSLTAAWALCSVLLLLHSLRFNFVTDDAYISFVYSRNLAEHGELTFNLGDYVEGYSNFSWTVLLAGLMKLGVAPELASRVLGTACGALGLWLTMRLARRVLGDGGHPLWIALPAALLAASAGYACWSSGGLETQLFTALCLAAFERAFAARQRQRGWWQLGALLALAAMTRPEGLLLAAVIGAAALVENLRATPRTLASVVPPAQLATLATFLALWLPWLAWRLWYYGWPFPNTYYVKAHGPWQPPQLAAEMWRNGAYYLWVWVRQTGLVWAAPLLVVGLAVAGRGHLRWRALAPLLGFAAVYLAYTVSVGGDFMGLHRFIMPVFAVAALAFTAALRGLAERVWPQPASRRPLGAALVCFAVFLGAQQLVTSRAVRWGNFDAERGIDTPAFLIAYTEDRAAIGKAMRGCFAEGDFSLVGGAGAQPYFGRMRAVDVFGLVSEDVAHRAPRIRARAGHTKFASDALQAELAPTFVFSCYALHREPAPPPLPCAAPWLGRGFEIVTMHVPALRQLGTYYSFLVARQRRFQCPGLTRAAG